MYLGLCLVGVIALVGAITAAAARPSHDVTSARSVERRRTHLRARPELVTRLDVESLLRSHPLPVATVARALGTCAERRVAWSVAWRWADRFGADKLVLALDADVAERRLVRHLDAGTTPDWQAMSLFAGLNRDGPAMPMAELIDPDALPDAVTADSGDRFDSGDWLDSDGWFDSGGWEVHPEPGTHVPEVDLSQFGHLPPIYDPGLPTARAATPPPDARPPLSDELDPSPPRKAGGDTDWPRVA